MARSWKRYSTLSLFLCAFLMVGVGCEKSAELKIESIEPNIGPTSGGHVTIHGTGFQKQGPVDVTIYFGKKKGRVSEVKSGEIIARAPAGEAGAKVEVRVIFGNGREFVVKNGYEYRAGAHTGMDVDALTEKKKK